MITFFGGNVLTIKNQFGVLTLEDDIQDGVSLHLSRNEIALRMTALYTDKELLGFLSGKSSCNRIASSVKSDLIGSKKVLSTCFRYQFKTDDVCLPETFLMLISEDTTYYYYLADSDYLALSWYLKRKVGLDPSAEEQLVVDDILKSTNKDGTVKIESFQERVGIIEW